MTKKQWLEEIFSFINFFTTCAVAFGVWRGNNPIGIDIIAGIWLIIAVFWAYKNK